MADTTFQDRQTPILASWLNDVNRLTYDIGSTASGKGASLVGLQDAGGYLNATNVEAAFPEVIGRMYATNADDPRFGVLDKTGATDCSAVISAAFAVSDFVYLPAGIYKCSIALATHKRLIGAGMWQTFLKPVSNNSSVILLDATTVAKQWCTIEELQIYNPSSLTNCVGIEFRGTNVFSINDMHRLSRLEITDLLYGVKITGRHIGCQWNYVEVLRCDVGFKCNTDPVELAFIFNTFIECLFNDCRAEGMRIENISLTNKYITCNWQNNNTLGVAGVAGSYFKDQRNTSFDNCYWENNASGVVIDSVNPANNSIALWLDGTSITQRVEITNSWIVGSGTCVYITADPLYSGHISNTTLDPSGGSGWAFVSTAKYQAVEPFVFDPTMMVAKGKVNVQATDLSQNVGFPGNGAIFYYQNGAGTGPIIDMFKYRQVTINNAGVAMSITTVNNAQPGMELTIVNTGGANTTVAAGLISTGVANVIPSNTAKKFVVTGFPTYGKLAPI